MSPRVSVLLPVRDAAATLEAALRSVARQSLSDFECVVVDDGSHDASPRIATRFAQRDRRFVPVRRGRHGLVPALRAGLARCRGELVARMDADDLMHRDRLATQVALLDARADLAAVGSLVRTFPRSAQNAGRLAYETWLNGVRDPEDVAREAFVECPIAHPTLTIRRAVLERHGYRETRWPEDYDLVLRLLEAGAKLANAPRRLHAWRDSQDRLSRRHWRYAISAFVACKAAFLARGLLAAHERYVLWGFGHTGRALHRELARLDRRPACVIELHPGRLGNVIHGAPVLPPEALGALPDLPVVASVAGADARSRIRAHLDALGRTETVDYVCAA